MTNYRRYYIPNTHYFFTVNTWKRTPLFANKFARDCLSQAIHHTRERWPFQIVAFVLLPNHLHTIWLLPEDEIDYSTRWRLIKSTFTKLYLEKINFNIPRTTSRKSKNEQSIWQRRFWEHMIRNEDDFGKHFDYIHYNPVKHGYVENPRDWKWSTFHRYVKLQWYDSDWGETKPSGMIRTCVGE